MKLARKAVVAATMILGLTVACSNEGDGSEIVLTFAGFAPENSSAQTDTVKYWMDEVTQRTEGQVSFQESWGGALLPAGEIFTGVGDGRVDVGWETIMYYSEFPLTSISDLPFVTSNQQAVSETFLELYAEYDPLREEWENNGLELLSVLPAEPNITASIEPVRSLEDYDGMIVRALGAMPTALQLVDANPVAINVTELYEALERGTIDAYMSIPLTPSVGFSYYEVAPYATYDGAGIVSASQLAISNETFDSLPESVQQVMKEVAAELPEADAGHVIARDDASCDAWLDGGGSVYELPEAEIERWRDLLGDSATEDWHATAEERGQPSDEFYGLYHSVLEQKLSGQEEVVNGVQRCARR